MEEPVRGSRTLGKGKRGIYVEGLRPMDYIVSTMDCIVEQRVENFNPVARSKEGVVLSNPRVPATGLSFRVVSNPQSVKSAQSVIQRLENFVLVGEVASVEPVEVPVRFLVGTPRTYDVVEVPYADE